MGVDGGHGQDSGDPCEKKQKKADTLSEQGYLS